MTVLSEDATTARAWHQNPVVKFGLWVLGGAVAGYGVGWLLAEYEDRVPAIERAIGWTKSLDLASGFALFVAFMMIMLGLWLLALTRFSERRLRAALKSEPDESTARMRGMLPIAGWGMLLYAAIILAFVIPGIPAALGIAVVTLCFAAVSWLFWRGWQMSDELERAAQGEAVIATFLIIEALGIGWAVLHHYALAPAMQPVALVTLLTVIYFFAGMIASLRRGLGR